MQLYSGWFVAVNVCPNYSLILDNIATFL